MKGGKESRKFRKIAGGTLRRTVSTVLWVACAGLFAQAAYAQSTGVMTIIAGSTAPPPSVNSCFPAITPTPLCNAGYAGDNGPAIQANLYSPSGVAFDPKTGYVYIADGRNGVIRQIDNGGTITTYAVLPGAGSGTVANAVTVDTTGNVYYGDNNGFVYKNGTAFGGTVNTQVEALITDAQGNLYELATVQGTQYQLYENGALLADTINTTGIVGDSLYGLAVNCSSGVCNVYSIDPIYKGGPGGTPTPTILQFVITTTGGVPSLTSLTYVAQSAGTSAVFGQSLALDGMGNFYINEGSAVVEYTPGAASSVALAGTGTDGFNGNDASDCTPIPGNGAPDTCYNLGGVPLPATSTDINGATGIFVTAGGVLYIADTVNNLIRRESNSSSTGCQECGPTSLSLSDQLPVISYGFAVNPVTQELYVPRPSAIPSANGVVNVYSAAYPATDTLIASIPVGPLPGQVVIDSVNNLIYVPNTGASTVTVIDGSTNTVKATVTIAGQPGTIAVDPPLNKAYVAIFNGSTINVVGPPDPVTGVIPSQATTVSTGTFPAFNTLSALAVDTNTKPGGGAAARQNLVYARCFCLSAPIGDENYSMAIIDATTDAVINEVSAFTSLPTTVYSDSLAVDETSGNVVIADAGNPSLHVWSYANQAFNNPYYPIPGFYPNHLVVDSNNEIAYFTDGYGNSASLNFTTFQEFSLSQAPNVANTCGGYSNVFAVDPSTDQAYMTTCPVTGLAVINGSNTQVTSVQLSLIDGPSGSIINTLLLPTSGTNTAGSSASSLIGPFVIAENPSTQVVYVGNSVSNTINVVNGFLGAARPFLTFSASPLTFPPAGLGTTPTATLTVTNDCTQSGAIGICGGGIAQTPLTASIVNAQGGSGTIAPQGCTFPLAVFASCQYLVTFTPTSSTFSGSILFTDDALDTPQTVNFSGTYGLTTIQLAPSSLNFGAVPENVSVSLPVTVTNTGNVPLTISNISFAGGSSADFTEFDTCHLNPVASGASCTITVYYIPTTTDTIGAQETGTLQLTANVPGGPQTVTVTGTSAAPNQGYGIFSQTSVEFGNIEATQPSATQQITMTNDGGAALSISGISVTGTNGTNPADFQESDTCPRGATQLQQFATCQIYVTFVPTSTPIAPETAQILISDSSPSGVETISLSGTSSAPLGPPLPGSLPELVSSDNSVPPNTVAYPSGGILEPASVASLSSGGQFVAFSAGATNLPGPFQSPYGPLPEVYLRNTCMGAGFNCEQGTTFIAYGPVTGPGANGGAACGPGSGPTGYTPFLGSNFPAIDSSGAFVAFTSDACQFSTITSANANQIYLRNLSNGTTSLVSLDSTGSPLSSGVPSFTSASPFSMNTNPKSLAFAYETPSPNVVAGVTNTNAYNEIYWTDTVSTKLVSQDSTNTNVVANNTAEEPSISPDGRYVAFASTATNLLSGTLIPAGSEQVYLRDTCAGVATGCTPSTILISQDSSGNVASGTNPSVSNGGRFVVFVSSDTSLLPAGVTEPQIFLRDTQNQTTTLLSQLNGSAGNGASSYPFISADGRLITFMSNSSNLNSAASANLAIYEYDTCLNAAGSCTAGLHVFLPYSTTTFSSGGSPAAVDATDQFVSFDVFASNAGYPVSQLYEGQTTVVAPPPSPTSTALALSTGGPISFGTPVTLTATVAVVSPGTGTPTGTVTFLDGTTSLGTSTLNPGGVATLTISSLAVGSHTFTANYGGTSAYSASSASAPPLTVSLAQSSVVLTPSASSIFAGQTLILTAVVSIPGGTAIPSGNINFFNKSTLLGPGTTTASSPGSLTQTFSVSGLTAGGPYTFSAFFSGDINYTSSYSNPVQVTVTAAPPPAIVTDNETITVTDSPVFPDVETIIVTDTVKVTACTAFTISPSGTLTAATVGTAYSQPFTASAAGTFTWTASGTVPAGLSINASTGVLSGTPTAAGTFSFTVTATDPNGCPGTVNVALAVNSAQAGATTTTITSTSSSYQGLALPANFALVGNPVTVNFTVQPTSGSAPATGTVNVTDGFNDRCPPATLTSAASGTGSCALTISQLGSGSTPLTATYSPDANSSGLLSSTSSPVAENLVQIVSCGTPPSAQTSAQGATVTYTVSICLAGDVQAVPAAVVTGCPPNAQCSATITAVPNQPGVYSVVVTIVLQGTAGSVPLQDPGAHNNPWRLPLFGFGVLLAMLMLLQLARQNRARPRLLYAAGLLIAVLLSGMSGCSNASNSTNNATPTGNFVIDVKVTAGNLSTTVPLTLTVTK